MVSPLSVALEFLFPGSCVVCGRELCRICPEHRPQFLSPEGRCPRCFFQLHRGKCLKCLGQEIFFDSHRSLYSYNASIRQLIGRWKFENDRPIGGLWISALTEILGQMGADRAGAIDSERRLRSFRPARDLLRAAGIAKVPCGIDLRKKRIARTRKQSQRNQAGRYFEVRDSLELLRDLSRVEHYVLLDDVFTTGATANEAARMLKKCGVSRVSVLTIAMREELELE
jgi:predicted amidophosphoribosyltransferase